MTEPVKLVSPITRTGADPIAAVTVVKPTTSALRGTKLTDVLQMDVTAMTKLLPRVTQPALLPDEVAALDPADLLSLSAQVVGFFMTPEQVAQAEADLKLN